MVRNNEEWLKQWFVEVKKWRPCMVDALGFVCLASFVMLEIQIFLVHYQTDREVSLH